MPDPTQIPVLGLLGGVGAGKSTVARALGSRGAIVLDADAEARAALAEPDLGPELVALFGQSVLDSHGSPRREVIAEQVFGPDGQALRKRLEALVHPRVRRRLREAIASARRSKPAPPLIILDVPLLLESPLLDACDRLAFIESTAADRVARTTEHRGWSADEVARREAHQAAIDEKRAAADLVIDNRGGLSDLEAAIDSVWRALTAPVVD